MNVRELATGKNVPIPDAADETRLIAIAAAGGEQALGRLVQAYREVIAKIGRKIPQGTLEADDITQAGVIGIWRACQEFDPERSNRLASLVTMWVLREMSGAVKSRPSGAQHKASREGRDTKVYVVPTDDFSFLESPFPTDDYDALETRLLAERALSVLDETARSVCRLAYGFESYGEPKSDLEVAGLLGLSRQKVQRTRVAALETMYVEIGAL